MKIYGLTGGIAAGKSEASRRFVELGIPVIDADRVGHEVIEPGGAAEQAVLDAFGEDILTQGRIDREKLGPIVFADPEARMKLNRIVHPAIGRETARRFAALSEEGHAAAIYDAPLLAEDGALRGGMAGLILVNCPREERLRRLVRLRGMSEEEALRRIGAQTPPEKKIPLATWVVENTGSIEDLRAHVDAIAKELG